MVLLGRNGAGKSTTLKTIIGLARAASGEIEFRGRAIQGLMPYEIAGSASATCPRSGASSPISP